MVQLVRNTLDGREIIPDGEVDSIRDTGDCGCKF